MIIIFIPEKTKYISLWVCLISILTDFTIEAASYCVRCTDFSTCTWLGFFNYKMGIKTIRKRLLQEQNEIKRSLLESTDSINNNHIKFIFLELLQHIGKFN